MYNSDSTSPNPRRTIHPQLYRLRRAGFLLLAMSLLPTAAVRACMTCDLTDGVNWHYVAVQDGNWHAASTWAQGAVPASLKHVRIPAGITVTVRDQRNEDYKKILVEGKLSFAMSEDTRLKFDTLIVAAGGEWRMGNPNNRYTSNAELIVVDTVALDAAEKGRGIVCAGKVRVFGNYKTPFLQVNGDLLPGDTSVTLASAPVGWAVGDDVMVAGTRFNETTTLRNEFRSIASINGSTITLNAPLNWNHIRPQPSKKFHVANLTRNIQVKSESTANIHHRGHVMFMDPDVKLENVQFRDLGRSDKTKNASTTNPEGRYSCHFHRARYAQEAVVADCVVWGTPGWGFVNHSSWVTFSECVAVDFVGAGFNAESGDEIGSFIGNLAAHGTGNGEFFETGEYNLNKNADRVEIGDLAWTGVGFWMVSPRVAVEDNVAAGLKAAGFQFMPAGKKESSQGGKYIGMPMDRVPAGVTPRTWKHANPWTGDTMALSSDLPLLSFKDNTAYGCYQGTRMRWVSHHGSFVYDNTGDFTGTKIKSAAGFTGIHNAGRKQSHAKRLHVWNVDVGHHHRYNEKMVRDDCSAEIEDVVGKQTAGFDVRQGVVANKILNCTVKRFNVGMKVQTGTTLSNNTFIQCNQNVIYN